MNDQFYIDITRAGGAADSADRAAAQVTAEKKLADAGVGQDVPTGDFDLAAMEAAGEPLDGTFSNEYAQPNSRLVGRFDAATGKEVVGPESEDAELFAPLQEGAAAAAEKAGDIAADVAVPVVRGVYRAGKSVWDFAGDVAEWLGADPETVYRPPTLNQLDVMPEPRGGVGGAIAESVVQYGLAAGAAYTRLTSLAGAPKTVRAAVAGATADVVVGDPKRDSIIDAVNDYMVASTGAELALLNGFKVRELAIEGTPVEVMAARLILAGEGAVLGGALDLGLAGLKAGGRATQAAAQKLWLQADELERTAVQAMAKNRYTFHSGIDPADVGWLTVWMAARITKGAKKLTKAMREQLRGTGATEDQLTNAWNEAAGLTQEARGSAVVGYLEDSLEQAAYLAVQEGDLGLAKFRQAATSMGLDEGAAREIWERGAARFMDEEIGRITGEPFRTADPDGGLSALDVKREGLVPTGEGKKKTTAGDFQARALAAQPEGVPTNMDESPENIERVAKFFAREVEMAMRQPGSAGDWYRQSIDKYHDLAALRWPEIRSDPQAQLAFDYATAVTSNGETVTSNMRLASRAYQHFRETGKFPEEVASKRSAAMGEHFRLWNRAVDVLGREGWSRFLHTEWTGPQFKAFGYDVPLAKGETAPGSIVLGPKIGGAFFQNLEGNFDRSTIDLWYRRTFGRATGAVKAENPELLARRSTRLLEAAAADDATRALVQAYTGSPELPSDPEGLALAAEQIYNAWANDKAGLGKNYKLGVSEEVDRFHRAARELSKLANEPIDAPSDVERRIMEAAAERSVELLQDAGYDTTLADQQALLWYWEQRLWKRTGVDVDSSTDYPTELAAALREEGDIDDEAVQRILAGAGGGPGAAGRAARPVLGSDPSSPEGQAARRKLFKSWSGDDYRAAVRDGADPAGRGVYAGGNRGGTARVVTPEGTRSIKGRVWRPDRRYANRWQAFGSTPPKYVEPPPSAQAGETYHSALMDSDGAWERRIDAEPNPRVRAQLRKARKSVTIYDPADYADARVFLAEDGKSGFALDGDDIVSVFKHPDSTNPDQALHMLALAVRAGGRTLDNFDGPLSAIYQHAGFRPVSRTAFDLRFKPPGWDARSMGKPDIVFMVYDPQHNVRTRIEDVPIYSSYDEAAAVRDAEVASFRGEVPPDGPAAATAAGGD